MSYRPSSDDDQKTGGLKLLEAPIAQFAHSGSGMAKRMAWRLKNGCFSLSGLKKKTKMLTELWDALPLSPGPLWVFHFHPEDLAGEGLARFQNDKSFEEHSGR